MNVASDSVLIDANIFLELELEQSKSSECEKFLAAVAKGSIGAIVTDFLLDGIAVIMEDRRASPQNIIRFFESLSLFKGLTIYNLGLRGRIDAAQMMIDQGADFDDATSLAAMKALGIKRIVSFDRHFDRFSGITRLEPNKSLQ